MTFDELLAPYDDHVRAIARGALHLCRELLPGGHETVHPGWKSVVIGRGAGMRDMVLVLSPKRDRVNIGLAGADLDDPAGLLEGAGVRARHVKVSSLAQLERPELRALLAAAVAGARSISGARDERDTASRARTRPPSGFKIDRARTIDATPDALWHAWSDGPARERWLGAGHPISVRTATAPRSLRATWADGSSIAVQLAPAPGATARTVVRVEHSRLDTPEAADAMRAFWTERLDRLRGELAGA